MFMDDARTGVLWIVGIFDDEWNFSAIGWKQGFIVKDSKTCIG